VVDSAPFRYNRVSGATPPGPSPLTSVTFMIGCKGLKVTYLFARNIAFDIPLAAVMV
jgi:hypothetical protein